MKIEYAISDQRGLAQIGPLWEKLNELHKVKASNHAKHFASMNFAIRKKYLLEKAQKGALRIDLAKDVLSHKIVGYCVSTVVDNRGEIDSIFVEEDYRLHGIGGDLLKNALEWMDQLSVNNRIIIVAAGNEKVFSFYAKYNFYPRSTILAIDRQ